MPRARKTNVRSVLFYSFHCENACLQHTAKAKIEKKNITKQNEKKTKSQAKKQRKNTILAQNINDVKMLVQHMKKNARKDTFRHFRFILFLNMQTATGIRLPFCVFNVVEGNFWHDWKYNMSKKKINMKNNNNNENTQGLYTNEKKHWLLQLAYEFLSFAHENLPFVDLFCQQFQFGRVHLFCRFFFLCAGFFSILNNLFPRIYQIKKRHKPESTQNEQSLVNVLISLGHLFRRRRWCSFFHSVCFFVDAMFCPAQCFVYFIFCILVVALVHGAFRFLYIWGF